MTYRIGETGGGTPSPTRRITLSLMVFPGVIIPAGNRETPAPRQKTAPEGLLTSELATAAGLIDRQLRQWRAFILEVGSGTRLRYEFRFREGATSNARPVCNLGTTGFGETVDDLSERRQAVGARTHVEAVREARESGFDNIAIVHPTFSFNPHGRIANPDGTFPDVDWNGRRVMSSACNLIRLRFDKLGEPGNLTAAHEAGHLMGLGHVRADGVTDPGNPLMVSQDTLPRVLHRSDELNLHESAETLTRAHGVIWESGHVRRDIRPLVRRRRARASGARRR